MTSQRCPISSSLVVLALLTLPTENPAFVKASLPPLSKTVSDTSYCQEGCTCESILQLVRCAHVNLFDIPYPGVRNNTRVLYLPGNAISSLTQHTLQRLRQLRLLDLADNQISYIADDAFKSQSKMINLDLSGNHLDEVPVQALGQLKSLRSLDLARNRITFLTSASFANLTKLQNLSLSSNTLQMIDADAFVGLYSLRVLHLDDNVLSEIPVGVLRDCIRLQQLHVSTNSIGTFVNNSEALGQFSAQSWFEPTGPSRLKVLKLSHNYIDMFAPLCFGGMTELTELDLSSNYILEIPDDLFQDLVMLSTLRLSRNSPLQSIPSGAFRSNHNLSVLKVRNCQLTNLAADLFSNASHLEVLDLTGNGICDTSFLSASYMPSLKRLFLGSNSISSFPGNDLSSFTFLEKLDISGNLLTVLPNIKGLGALEALDVSNNSLTWLGTHAFDGMSLKFLDLSSNRLQTIQEETFLVLPDRTSMEINLDDNPWVCDCHLKWLVSVGYQQMTFGQIVTCTWPPEWVDETFYAGVYYEHFNLVCTQYPRKKNLYVIIAVWFGVVAAMILVFWAAVFHRARRRFKARRPREHFLLFRNPNETNAKSTGTTGHSKVRFKALDSETESLYDDETTV